MIIRLELKKVLNRQTERRFPMFALTRIRLLSFAAAGALVALTAAGPSARADDLPQSLGPVGPYETILPTFGNKRAIAFYEPDNGRCAVSAVVYDKTDASTGMTTAARVRVSLSPREIVHIDSTDNETLNLQCGENAEKLTIVDTDSAVASGITIQPPKQPIEASTSGF